MPLSIDEKAQFLPEDARKEFYSGVLDCIYNPDWCIKHNLPVMRTNIEDVKEILFREKYADKIYSLSVRESGFQEISESDFPAVTTPTPEELLLR
jgi:hypothetical protein